MQRHLMMRFDVPYHTSHDLMEKENRCVRRGVCSGCLVQRLPSNHHFWSCELCKHAGLWYWTTLHAHSTHWNLRYPLFSCRYLTLGTLRLAVSKIGTKVCWHSPTQWENDARCTHPYNTDFNWEAHVFALLRSEFSYCRVSCFSGVQKNKVGWIEFKAAVWE